MRLLARPAPAQDGILSDPEFAELAASTTLIRLPKGATLYRAGEPAAALYEIVHGGIRTFLTLPDGGETVTGFRSAGDVFGLASGGHYTDTAEAIAPTLVHRFERERLTQILRHSPAAARRLLELAMAELDARTQQVALLARADTLGRLALFLRMIGGGANGDAKRRSALRLAMSRSDIARYVGLSTAAVSRGFRTLVERRIVQFHSRRRLDLIDPQKLDALIATRPRRVRNGRAQRHGGGL